MMTGDWSVVAVTAASTAAVSDNDIAVSTTHTATTDAHKYRVRRTDWHAKGHSIYTQE